MSVVQLQLVGEPVGQRDEASADDGQSVAQRLQRSTELTCTGRDADDRLEPLEDVGGHALE